ncbi:hypothetical protein BGW42_005191 [Actinomortierella wolfii]|nr:hypothetical protein BGW42_005191 [Actinomortierella wolfii]
MGADEGVLTKLFDSQSAKDRLRRRSPGRKAFVQWMQKRHQDPLKTTAMDLMNFLNHGLEGEKWKLNTLLTYKSAILQLLPQTRRQEISEDEMFKDFLKTTVLLQKVLSAGTYKRLRNDNVDLQPVLAGLQAMGDNHCMSMTDLTAKLCFLLATCGLMRADDLACVDAKRSKVGPDQLDLVVVFPTEKRGNQLIIKPVIIRRHPVEAFCPVRAYVEYRRRTADHDRFATGAHRKLDSEPFTPLIRHVRSSSVGLTAERISKYIQKILQLLPPEASGRPYKARAIGATAALQKGVPVDDVTTQGNWPSPAIH